MEYLAVLKGAHSFEQLIGLSISLSLQEILVQPIGLLMILNNPKGCLYIWAALSATKYMFLSNEKKLPSGWQLKELKLR